MSMKNMATKSCNSHAPHSTYNSTRREPKLWPIRPIDNDTASEEGILENNNRYLNNNGSQAGSETRIIKTVDISVTTETP